MDDASRKLLSYGEFEHATAENSIMTMKQAIENAAKFYVDIKAVNTDRGTQFYSNKKGISSFQRFLEEEGIDFIPSKRNNSQTRAVTTALHITYR